MSFFRTKSFLGATLGSMIEYYDMILYIIFLPLISPLLFGGDSAMNSLTMGYTILFITMLTRPMGGLFFGYIGDHYGRPKAMLSSMYGIAIATFIIGITPTYESIGLWAVVIICLAKSLQTFCFGGEFTGAGIYVVEHAREKNECYTNSIMAAVAISGSLIASILGVLLTFDFIPVSFWRIPFLLGASVGVVGVMFRKKMLESPAFTPATVKEDNLIAMFKQYPLALIVGCFVGGMSTIGYTSVVAFINPILLMQGHIDKHSLMLIQSLIIGFSILMLPLAGKLADHFSAMKMMQIACGLMVISAPFYLLLDSENIGLIIFISLWIILLTELFFAPVHVLYKRIFPMPFRYRAASFSFCVGMSLFGGLTPLIENSIYQHTSKFYLSLTWFVINAALTLSCLILLDKKSLQVRPLQIEL